MGRLRGCAVAALVLVAAGGCVFPLREALVARSEALREIAASGAVHAAADHVGVELGTEAAPFTSAAKAIALAERLVADGVAEALVVRLAAGTYRCNETLVVPPRVSIRGGYSYPGWRYDRGGELPVISSGAECVIRFESGCTPATVLEDVRVVAATREETRGIECDGASPTIRRTRVDVRAGRESGIGLLLVSSEAVLDSNVVLFGSTSGSAWGIALVGASCEITNTVVSSLGGTGPNIGVHATDGSALLAANDTVYLPGSPGDTALFLSSSSARVENTILAAASDACGIHEHDGAVVVSALANNEFFRTAAPLYRTHDGSSLTSVIDMESYLGAGATGNDAGTDPAFADPGSDDFHPGLDPIIGLDLSARFSHDADGAPRTVPWSVGAYEFE